MPYCVADKRVSRSHPTYHRREVTYRIEFRANLSFQMLIRLHVVLRHEGDRTAGFARARCAADAVDVVLRRHRHVEVDDHVHGGDIKTTRRHIGCYKNVLRSGAEFVQRAEALRLRQLSVQTDRVEAQVAQDLRRPCRVVTRRDEHDDLLALEVVDDRRQVAVLPLGGDKNVLLNERLQHREAGVRPSRRHGHPQHIAYLWSLHFV